MLLGEWVGSGGGQSRIWSKVMLLGKTSRGHKLLLHKVFSRTSSSVGSIIELDSTTGTDPTIELISCTLALTCRCIEICQGNSPKEANSPLTMRVSKILSAVKGVYSPHSNVPEMQIFKQPII